MKKELSVQKKVSPNIYRSKKNFVPKNLWSKKKLGPRFWVKQNSNPKKCWSEKAMFQKNVGPQNIEPKVDKNWVSSSLDTLEMKF